MPPRAPLRPRSYLPPTGKRRGFVHLIALAADSLAHEVSGIRDHYPRGESARPRAWLPRVDQEPRAGRRAPPDASPMRRRFLTSQTPTQSRGQPSPSEWAIHFEAGQSNHGTPNPFRELWLWRVRPHRAEVPPSVSILPMPCHTVLFPNKYAQGSRASRKMTVRSFPTGSVCLILRHGVPTAITVVLYRRGLGSMRAQAPAPVRSG